MALLLRCDHEAGMTERCGQSGCGLHWIAYTRYMAKKRKYESRLFEGRVMTPADLERLHKEMLPFERIEAVSDEMRSLIE